MRGRLAAGLLGLSLLAACGGTGTPEAGSPAPRSPSSPSSTSATSSPGPNSAALALAALCPHTKPAQPPVGKTEPTLKEISTVESQVEQARGLQFQGPVSTKVVTPDQMKQDLLASMSDPAALKYLTAEGRALAVMGAIPDNVDLGKAIQDFVTAQVAGFYDPETKELVVLGQKSLTPLDRFVLSHELLHALDDQNFNLSRFSALNGKCQDEAGSAARAVTEGSATVFSLKVVADSFTALDQAALVKQGMTAAGAADVPASVPPFVTQLEEWPYLAGMKFVQFEQARGGDKAVNAALRHPPATTEQIIHPAKYPSDAPPQPDIPDIGPALGSRWTDLAVGQVGEAWLSVYLGLRLDASEAQVAAAGWDGGVFRAWTDGKHVAAILNTAWDTQNDSDQFGSAMKDWLAQGTVHAEIVHIGDQVQVVFASDEQTLRQLLSAQVG